MSPTATKAIRNGTLTLAVLGLGAGAATLWKRYGRLDPYAAMKRQRPMDAGASIKANDVVLRHYQNGKLVASANAKDLAINADRSGVTLKRVTNGLANTSQGAMRFKTDKGVIQPNARTVALSGNVQVNGKDGQGRPYLIQTAQADINGLKGQLTVPTPLKGTILGGPFRAESLVYRPNSDYTSLNKVVWRGKISQGTVPVTQGARAWNLVGKTVTKKGFIVTADDARAEDGETIVMAPNVVQNTKTDVITAMGRATYRSSKADLVADKIVVFRKEKRAVFTGNVVMYVRPKKDWDKPLPKNDVGAQPLVPDIPANLKAKPAAPDISSDEQKRDDDLRSGKTLRNYPMNLKAENVEYWYGEGNRHAVAKGGDPTAFQRFDDGRWRVANSIQANYDGEKDTLELLGDGTKRQVKMKNSIGDWIDAFWMRLSTKEDQTEEEDDMQAKSPIAHMISRDDDDGLSGGKKTTPPAKGGTTPPPTNPPATTPPATNSPATAPPAKTGP